MPRVVHALLVCRQAEQVNKDGQVFVLVSDHDLEELRETIIHLKSVRNFSHIFEHGGVYLAVHQFRKSLLVFHASTYLEIVFLLWLLARELLLVIE